MIVTSIFLASCFPNASEISLIFSTANVALDHYLMPSTDNNSLIHIGSPEKDQFGIKTWVSSAYSHHRISALQTHWFPPLQPLNPQLEQQVLYLLVGLNTG